MCPHVVTTGEVASIKVSPVQHFDLCLLSLCVFDFLSSFFISEMKNTQWDQVFFYVNGRTETFRILLPGKRTRVFAAI